MANQLSLEQARNKHLHCEIVIYNKKFSNGLVTPGLYCKEFGIWIQWLDIQTADLLIAEGVEQVLIEPKKRKRHPKSHCENSFN